jgi:DNA-binding GntR family transcriptional regulator
MSSDASSSVRKLSASESVRQQLEREISDGALMPGDVLDEEALAQRFKVSRTPVREALLQLSVRGLVSIAPRAGIYVSRLSIPELANLLELLAELEGACAKLATRRISAEDLAALRRVHDASEVFETTPDAQAYGRANAEFHEILYRACRNEALMLEIAHIRRRTQVYRQSVFQNQARIRRSREEHARILAALLAGDATAAGQLMIEHISIGGRDFRDFISTVPRRLLASEVEAYPGKATAERQRNDAAAALMPDAPTTAAPPTRRSSAGSQARKVARSGSR